MPAGTPTRLASLANSVFTNLVYLQRRRGIGPIVSALLRARGTYVPPQTVVGRRLRLLHTAHGVVIDDRTRIHDDVDIFHNVTVGRAKPWIPRDKETGTVTIEAKAMLCAGATVLVPAHGELIVREGSVVGANSVLTTSTNPWEIWAGNPARPVGTREP